jgi:RHS repeat-associated protein
VTIFCNYFNGFEERYNYDSLNRLDDWTKSGGGASGTIDVNYDSLGNISFKTGVGTYHYDNSAHAHAVSRISNGNLTGSYGYDNNGNMTSGGGRSDVRYNTMDKPTYIATAKKTVVYEYGMGGNRFKRIDTESGVTKTTLYVGNTEFISEGSVLKEVQRQVAGVALETFYPATNVRRLDYLHHDHLGSIDVITDENGAVVKKFSYDAWGQRRSVDDYNTTYGFTSSLGLTLAHYNKGFTGHEQLDASGLIHMNGRVYDPRLGRFLSADPMVQQEYNLQNLNRYSYVLNNPLNATDPSGYFWAKLFAAAAEYFSSDSFYQSLAMSAVSYADNGNFQFTYNSADANSYGQNAQRSRESQLFDSYDLGGSSNGLAKAKDEARVGGTVSSGVSGTNQSPNVGLDNETSEQISTFEGRAELYNQMQGKLDEAGIDTVWFGVAGELNDFFAQQETALKIGDFFTGGDTHDYLNDLGVDLYDKNKAAFNDLMSGTINIRGQKLDNYLVRREQGFVESYTVKRFGMSAPASSRILLNSTFITMRQLMPKIMQNSLQYIDNRHKGKFNFFDTYHRIELGQAMMSQARHVR